MSRLSSSSASEGCSEGESLDECSRAPFSSAIPSPIFSLKSCFCLERVCFPFVIRASNSVRVPFVERLKRAHWASKKGTDGEGRIGSLFNTSQKGKVSDTKTDSTSVPRNHPRSGT
eukprot:2137704-Rhodomonas_salina.1